MTDVTSEVVSGTAVSGEMVTAQAVGAGDAPVAQDWADLMLASYRTLNPQQAPWFDANPVIEAELLARLQPGEYLNDTFGPGGSNETEAVFVYCLLTIGDIVSRSITKTGDVLRWDMDGTVTVQNDLPAHTLGAGAGIVTLSSTDGWSGLTIFQIQNNQFTGSVPLWVFPSVVDFRISRNTFSGSAPFWDFPLLTIFYISTNQFTGNASLWDFPLLTDFYIYTNQFTGNAPPWDFPLLTNFHIYDNQFTGNALLWDFPLLDRFLISTNQFTGNAPPWDFPLLTIFNIYNNQFTGNAPLWDFPLLDRFFIYNNQFTGNAPLWDFPLATVFYIYDNDFNDFSAFLVNLYATWSSKIGNADLRMQTNAATLSGSYADEDPPTTDVGHIYELEIDPEATGFPVYTITYDVPPPPPPLLWADQMVASYRVLNPEQAPWFDNNPTIEAELLARLQPGQYLQNTFGPNGTNETEAGFVYLLLTTGDMNNQTIINAGNPIRWDIDGTVYNQDTVPVHSVGGGAGIVTLSSPDRWAGITTFDLTGNPFVGPSALWLFPNVADFWIPFTQFSSFSLSGLTAVSGVDAGDMGLTQAAVDAVLSQLYADRAAYTAPTPALNISGSNAPPSGTYQDATPPTTGNEYRYKLVNDPDAEGFNIWAITASIVRRTT